MLFLFMIVLIAIPTTIAIVFLATAKRRAEQGTVLWTLAIATSQNLPVIEELEAIGGGLSSSRRKRVERLIVCLEDGDSLADSLGRLNGLVPNFAVEAAHIGERNGVLPQCLRDAAIRHTTARAGTGLGVSTPTLTIAYLLAVPLIMWTVFQGVCYFIIPKYKKIFESFGVELPEVTKAAIGVSDFVVQYWFLFWPVFGLMSAAVVGIAVGYFRGWGELDVPIFGRWFRRLDVPNTLRNLAVAVENGGSLNATLETLGMQHRRRAVRRTLEKVAARCASGEDCWQVMHSSGLLNQHEAAVLQSAGRVGNLPWALRELAATIERRVTFRWQAVLEVAQPAVVVGLMTVGGLFMAAMFLPLVLLIQSVV